MVVADFEEPGDEDVYRKVRGDLDAATVSEQAIRSKMVELLDTAAQQIETEAKA